MIINKEGINKFVIPNIKNSYKYLEIVQKKIIKEYIPEDFKYAVYMKKMPQNIGSIINKMINIQNWAENVVDKFEKAEEKNKSLIYNLYSTTKEILDISANNIKTISRGLSDDSDIFNPNNIKHKQYGGNQTYFSWGYMMLKDPKIKSIIKQYWPNATDEDMEFLLSQISITGCGYVAMINSIFAQYLGKEELFEKTFGFPMYRIENRNGKEYKFYNYDYLILEYFCYVWKNSGYDIKELYTTDDKEGIETGTSVTEFLKFSNFMKEKYGINTKVSIISVDQNEADKTGVYKTLATTPQPHIILGAGDYDMFPTVTDTGDPLDNNGPVYNVGNHAQYVTGMSENGNIIVSSWGKEYEVNLNNIRGHCTFVCVEFENII